MKLRCPFCKEERKECEIRSQNHNSGIWIEGDLADSVSQIDHIIPNDMFSDVVSGRSFDYGVLGQSFDDDVFGRSPWL
jgi:hypothetical protein